MRGTLAFATLVRHRSRTALGVLGVAVAAAMLLDMVMLSTGLRASFRELLLTRGFQLRVSPKGTLPFDTDATITGAAAIAVTIASHPDIVTVSPVLGASLHVPGRDGTAAITVFALGVDPRVQGDYEQLDGRRLLAPDEMVANEEFLLAAGARVGDTLELAAQYDPQLRSSAGRRRLVIAGRARFLYMSAGQQVVAMPLATLQGMGGPTRADRASLFMVKARDGADIEHLRAAIAASVPSVTVISTTVALAQVDERLSYFRQLAVILGVVSLAVSFLLVTTLVTVSVNERIGEIAVMRAIGVSRAHIVQQVLIEGVVLSVAGALCGLVLGLATARYLNSILSSFPGLPVAIDFFLFQPRAAWTALGLLVLCGIASGIYPSWRAASLPIATTLRQEAIA